MLLEGKHAVLEALKVRMPLTEILLAETERSQASRDADRTLVDLLEYARMAQVPVRRTARRALDEMSERGAHQGVIARAPAFSYTPLSQILRASALRDNELIIVLDHVTDPGNLGAIARSAELCGARGLVVARNRAAAVTPGAHKAAAGALSLLPVARENNIVRALDYLKKEGFWCVGAAGEADKLAWDADLTGRIALVMGSEGAGLSRLVAETCDFLVALPQIGKIDSYNVAQACTALCYEYLRQTSA